MGDSDRTTVDDTAGLSLGKSSLVGTAGKFVLAVFGFAGIVFFYRDLGPTEIGAYYTILAGAKVGSQLQSGINSGVQKRVSEVDADHAAHLGLALSTWLAITGLGAVVVVLVAPIALRYVPSWRHLLAALALGSALALFATFNQFYTGVGNPGMANWMDGLRSVLTLAGQVTLVVLGFGEFGLVGGFVFGAVVTAVAVAVVLGVVPTVPSREVSRSVASFARWSVPTGLVRSFHDRMDPLVLWAVAGSTAVGFYQPAFQLTVPATFVASSISQSLTVKASGLDSQNRSTLGDLRNSLAYVGLVAVPIFFGALAIPGALMKTIFGPSATAATDALVVLAAFQLVRSYFKPVGAVVWGIDRPDVTFWFSTVVVVFNLPLAVWLGLNYGLLGVVVATLVAETFQLALASAATVRLVGNPGLPREVGEQILAGGVMFVLVESITTTGLLRITGILRLGIVVGLGAVVYFAVLGLVSSRFRRTLRAVSAETLPL